MTLGGDPPITSNRKHLSHPAITCQVPHHQISTKNPFWVCQCDQPCSVAVSVPGKMYSMQGNADDACSLFLESVSCWCSVLARRQWLMLKAMNVNCQTPMVWYETHISQVYCMAWCYSILSFPHKKQYAPLNSKHLAGGFWGSCDLWCFSLAWHWVRTKLFGFI